MTARIAINGFGRIGRMVLRAVHEQARQDIELVAINGRSSPEHYAFLLRHDTTHGPFPGEIAVDGDKLVVGERTIKCLSEPEPENLPWDMLNVDVVMECSGKFTKREAAAKHIASGARQVLVSAPSKGADITVVMGVNDDELTSEHLVVSNGSCTTNCLAPVAKVMDEAFGIEQGYMTTVHSYTGDQNLVDGPHKDPRRTRAGAQNIIPTSTGAARAVGEVLPGLAGRLDGGAVRVPSLNVSLVDFTFQARRPANAEEVRATARDASSSNSLKGVLGVCEEPLVSGDFNHDACSAVIDLPEVQVTGESFVRVVAWYDNEWAFSCRMCDTAAAMTAAR